MYLKRETPYFATGCKKNLQSKWPFPITGRVNTFRAIRVEPKCHSSQQLLALIRNTEHFYSRGAGNFKPHSTTDLVDKERKPHPKTEERRSKIQANSQT